MSDPVQRARLDAWEPSLLRVTLFFGSVAGIAEDAWHAVTGAEPTMVTRQSNPPARIEQGPFGSEHLLFSHAPGRFDLHVVPHPEAGSPVLGSYAEALASFQRAVDRLLEQPRPPVVRVAYGAITMLAAPDKQAAYRQLTAYLPSLAFAEGVTDLMIQLNWRRRSQRVAGLDLNRLSKWSVAQITKTLMVGAVVSAPEVVDTSFACRCELDLNTVPEHRLPPDADLSALLSEFLDLGREIVENGPGP